jgi:hypothetical protein
MTRQEIIDLIHNEYDPRPNLGRGDYPAFDWDDGSGRIADAVMARIEALEAALRKIVNSANLNIQPPDVWFRDIARAALAPDQNKA